jgi:hypothetical protein
MIGASSKYECTSTLPSAFIRVIRGQIRMPDEMLTPSATFNRSASLFVSFVVFCKNGSRFLVEWIGHFRVFGVFRGELIRDPKTSRFPLHRWSIHDPRSFAPFAGKSECLVRRSEFDQYHRGHGALTQRALSNAGEVDRGLRVLEKLRAEPERFISTANGRQWTRMKNTTGLMV